MAAKDEAWERANKLFNRSCTCGGIDIGVGQTHEPQCGLPTPDVIAAALLEIRKEALEEAARVACKYCADGEPLDKTREFHRVTCKDCRKNPHTDNELCKAQAIRRLGE